MNRQHLMNILISPHITEKSTQLADKNKQFVFKIAKVATKIRVKEAVEFLYDVKVNSVQVVNVKGKSKRFGSTRGSRKSWKKAYVSLKEGFDINFMGPE